MVKSGDYIEFLIGYSSVVLQIVKLSSLKEELMIPNKKERDEQKYRVGCADDSK